MDLRWRCEIWVSQRKLQWTRMVMQEKEAVSRLYIRTRKVIRKKGREEGIGRRETLRGRERK